ncbi:hypothetical protein J8273_6996 [Carpediemonas membranifera]|uniref:Uncharacterized protein n=1 Tax=Carpediemonas membranifera TaxID=201153 RepID=A0A8J6DZI0_9EUKA|nr:hypothetical protein J8273_6996 [Carpediemonas membranifera]|eukprot:KAG9390743.1 hypothetical protein J8273_6996 [Carpediemonas membranifera]
MSNNNHPLKAIHCIPEEDQDDNDHDKPFYIVNTIGRDREEVGVPIFDMSPVGLPASINVEQTTSPTVETRSIDEAITNINNFSWNRPGDRGNGEDMPNAASLIFSYGPQYSPRPDDSSSSASMNGTIFGVMTADGLGQEAMSVFSCASPSTGPGSLRRLPSLYELHQLPRSVDHTFSPTFSPTSPNGESLS